MSLRPYRVVLLCDRYDPEQGKVTVTVRARDPRDARATARDAISGEYPTAVDLRADAVPEVTA